MCKVHNKHHRTAPSNAVYIGHRSAFGNPFRIGKDGDRDTVCDKYEQMLAAKPEMLKLIKRELKGRDLICCCKPKRCHGDTLLRIANSEDF